MNTTVPTPLRDHTPQRNRNAVYSAAAALLSDVQRGASGTLQNPCAPPASTTRARPFSLFKRRNRSKYRGVKCFPHASFRLCAVSSLASPLLRCRTQRLLHVRGVEERGRMLQPPFLRHGKPMQSKNRSALQVWAGLRRRHLDMPAPEASRRQLHRGLGLCQRHMHARCYGDSNLRGLGRAALWPIRVWSRQLLHIGGS